MTRNKNRSGPPAFILLFAAAIAAWPLLGCAPNTIRPESTPTIEPNTPPTATLETSSAPLVGSASPEATLPGIVSTYVDSDGVVRTRLEPPPASLETDGGLQTAAIGTFCWYGYCADAFSSVTPQEALIVTSPLRASLRLPIDEPPLTLQVRAVRVSADSEIAYSGGGWRWWDINPFAGEPTELLLQREQDIELELEIGLYVLSIFGAWDTNISGPEGDVIYGFLIEVKESNQPRGRIWLGWDRTRGCPAGHPLGYEEWPRKKSIITT